MNFHSRKHRLSTYAPMALALWLIGTATAHALDCWVPTLDTTQPRYAKEPLAGMREAVKAAEQMVRDNPHFKAMPRPIRIRSQFAVGPAWAQLNVNAYQPKVWEGTCGLVKGADRCCTDGNVNIMFNSPDSILNDTDASDDQLHIFKEPRRTGTVAGFPEYDDKRVFLSVGGRVPWQPATVADYLDLHERQQRARIAEFERNRPAVHGLDPKTVQAAYEGMKQIDTKAAEEYLARMQAQMEQAAAAGKKHDERARQLLNAGLEEIMKLRASLTPAQLGAQAFRGKGPLQLGRADDPLSTPLVKRDPSFPDKSDPNRVQMISVFVAVVDNDPVIERRTTMQRTKDTLDYARLEKLLQ